MALADKSPRLPPPNVPMIDARTGLMTKDWYDFFVALLAWLEKVRAAIP